MPQIYGTAFAITPSDTVLLPRVVTGIYVGGTGTVAVGLLGQQAPVTFIGVPAGTVLPIQAQQVFVEGTSATGLIGLA